MTSHCHPEGFSKGACDTSYKVVRYNKQRRFLRGRSKDFRIMSEASAGTQASYFRARHDVSF